jgi:hypothetical protein
MTFSLAQILGGFVAPVLLVALITALAWRLGRDARWVFGPLIALAFCMCYWAVEPRIDWPPSGNALYYPFYFVIVAGVLTFADSLLKPPMWLRVIVLFLLWRPAVRLMLARLVPHSLSVTDLEMWIDVWSLVTAVWFLIFESVAERVSGISAPLLLFAVCGTSAIVLALGWHIQSSGALAGVLSLVCLGAAAAGLVSRNASFSRGFCQMVIIIVQLLLVHGYFYTDDNLTDTQQVWIALLLGSPLLAFIGDLPMLRNRRPAMRLAFRLAPAMLLLAVVCAVTARDFVRADQAASANQEE